MSKMHPLLNHENNYFSFDSEFSSGFILVMFPIFHFCRHTCSGVPFGSLGLEYINLYEQVSNERKNLT